MKNTIIGFCNTGQNNIVNNFTNKINVGNSPDMLEKQKKAVLKIVADAFETGNIKNVLQVREDEEGDREYQYDFGFFEGYYNALKDVLECIENNEQETPLYAVTIEDVQAEAEQLVGRKMSEEELSSVKKGLESGLGTACMDVLPEAIKGAKNSKIMDYEDFEESYKPIQNPYTTDAPHDNCMFEVDGMEGDYVRSCDIYKVWTIIEVEGESFIVPGFRMCDRLGYFITEVKWHDESFEVNFL